MNRFSHESSKYVKHLLTPLSLIKGCIAFLCLLCSFKKERLCFWCLVKQNKQSEDISFSSGKLHMSIFHNVLKYYGGKDQSTPKIIVSCSHSVSTVSRSKRGGCRCVFLIVHTAVWHNRSHLLLTCNFFLFSYQGNSEEVGCYVAGHPLSKGNCYFEVRLVDSDAVSQPLTLLLKVSSASFPRVFFFFLLCRICWLDRHQLLCHTFCSSTFWIW